MLSQIAMENIPFFRFFLRSSIALNDFLNAELGFVSGSRLWATQEGIIRGNYDPIYLASTTKK
jgi:hypothetical protein